MGLDISGHALCRFVQNVVLRDYLHDFAASYSDNIFVYTKVNDFNVHLSHIRKVLLRILEADMSVKPSKAFIGMTEVKVAGVVVSQLKIFAHTVHIVLVGHLVGPTRIAPG